MKEIFTIPIFTLIAFGCQKPFKTRGQTEKKVDKKGYRVGRWADNIDPTGVNIDM